MRSADDRALSFKNAHLSLRSYAHFVKRAISFYRDHIYPRLVSNLGDPEPIREVRQQIIPWAQGEVLEIGVGSGVTSLTTIHRG
jgi:hypothetical protein